MHSTKIALVYGSKLGDGLIGMTLTHNFYLNGYTPVTFSDSASELRDLFPNYPIEPMVACTDERLACFDMAVYPYACPIEKPTTPINIQHIAFREQPFFNQVVPMRETFAMAGRELFGFEKVEMNTPVKVPGGAKVSKQIAIHTTAGEAFRCWGKKRFFELASSLEVLGFKPVFLVAPHEKKDWDNASFPTITFKRLSDLAKFLANSDFFIGGDSGPGHLAALLGTPTLTLASRKTTIKRWAPTNDLNRVILPLPILPSARLRTRHWQHFLSPKRVLKQFLLLTEGKSA